MAARYFVISFSKTENTLGKSNYFSSKSVFGQLIPLIDNQFIKGAVKKSDSDRYLLSKNQLF